MMVKVGLTVQQNFQILTQWERDTRLLGLYNL